MSKGYIVMGGLVLAGVLVVFAFDVNLVELAGHYLQRVDGGVESQAAVGAVAAERSLESPCMEYSGWGENRTSALDDGYWYFSKPNVSDPECVREFRLDTDTCSLKHYSVKDIKTCLAGKHIVFIGDSLTRYMFQALIILLASGSPPYPINPPEPHQTNKWMTEHLGYVGCGGPIRCDRVGEKIMDNIYYHDSEFSFNASFLGYFDHGYGHAPVGWFPVEPPWTSDLLWNEAHMPQLAGVIRDHFGTVDEIIANSGQWHVPEFEKGVDVAEEQLKDFAALINNGKMPIWQSSTLNFGFPFPDHEYGTQAALRLGWRVFDRKSLSQTLARDLLALGYEKGDMGFVDVVHFQPYANVEINNALLNMLCYEHDLNSAAP